MLAAPFDSTAAHRAFVAYNLETAPVPSSVNYNTPEQLSPAPTAGAVLLGYSDLPERRRGFNNSRGYSVASATSNFTQLGPVRPTLTYEGKRGSLGLLSHCQRKRNGVVDNDQGVLPYLCFIVGVPPITKTTTAEDGTQTTIVVSKGWTDVYRYCKVGTLEMSLEPNQALEITLRIEAMAFEKLATPLAFDVSSLANIGAPLMFHDVRQLFIENASGALTNHRVNVEDFRLTIEQNLRRLGQRTFWGFDNPLSNTSREIIEGRLDVSGEIVSCARLEDAMFTAPNWGSIGARVSNAENSKSLNFTLFRCVPSDEIANGAQANGNQTFTVPFSAADYKFE